MAGNKDLSNAIKAKKDEFYTQLVDIEKEMKYYRDYFKGKTVFLNCDDPYESNFFKYFAMNFNRLGLKKLISTCYKGSPVAQTQLPLFGDIETSKDEVRPYKIEITEVSDENNDGKIDLSDVEYLLQSDKNVLSVLDGDGDFRSEECVALLDEADVVITNPPFSLFREYISLLVEHEKDFIILGNQNAITYKETFPLIKENKVWLGASIHSGDREFRVPDTYPLNASGCRVDENGVKYIRVKGIRWFTNIDYKQRHENLILCEKYDPEKYPKYDNYDAIEVGKVVDIPCDYEEGYLVPVEYKQQLIDAGFTLGSERLDSSGNLCVCVCGHNLTAEDCPRRADTVLLRRDGRSDNLPGQIRPDAVSDFGSDGERRERLFQRDLECEQWDYTASHKWEQEIQKALHSEERFEWSSGLMGVPITFIDKYSPEQFEVLGITDRDCPMRTKTYTKDDTSSYSDLNRRAAIRTPNGYKGTYARLLIRKKM